MSLSSLYNGLRSFFSPGIQTTSTPGAFGPSSVFMAGRDAPEGSLGWYVDCSGNPMDLRPAVDTILHAIDETRGALQPGQPLVVLVGETHTMPTHKYLLPLVATRLAARGEFFSVALEGPHNDWLDSAVRFFDLDVPGYFFKVPGNHYDPDGRGGLSAVLACNLSRFSPLSVLDGMDTLYKLVCDSEGRIRTLFNDVAKDRSFLDLSDSLTAQAARIHDIERTFVNASSPNGMSIRNRVMTDIAMDHARRHQVPLILQQAGRNHVFGDADRGFSFENSLYARIRDAGAVPLPVFATTHGDGYGLNVPPSEACGAFARAVVIDGFSEEEFDSVGGTFEDWEKREPESHFIQNLCRASGREGKDYSRHASRSERLMWTTVARQHAIEILDNYKKNQQAVGVSKNLETFDPTVSPT